MKVLTSSTGMLTSCDLSNDRRNRPLVNFPLKVSKEYNHSCGAEKKFPLRNVLANSIVNFRILCSKSCSPKVRVLSKNFFRCHSWVRFQHIHRIWPMLWEKHFFRFKLRASCFVLPSCYSPFWFVELIFLESSESNTPNWLANTTHVMV